MGRVTTNGRTAGCTKENTKKAKKMGMAYTFGLMVAGMKVIGKTAARMAKVLQCLMPGEVTYQSGNKEKAVWIMGKPVVISKS